MRPVVLALLLILPLAAAPTAPAQEAASLLTDEKGDVMLEVGDGTSQPASGEFADRVDLVGLSLLESEESVRFTLQTATVKGRGFVEHDVSFTWRDVDHVIRFGSYTDLADPAGNGQHWACLLRIERGDEDYVYCDEVAVDEAAATRTVDIPKYAILDKKDRMPLKGDKLTGLRADATSDLLFGGNLVANRFVDHMPDEASGGLDFLFTKGDFSTGHVLLGSEDRVRVSNGGSTTFVFQAFVRNTGEMDDEVSLSVIDLPAGWNATVQSPVKVPAKGERPVAVLASVPFAHEHGGFSAFNLSARSVLQPEAQAKLRLGVLHTPIPQPAGHHPDLFLHAETYNFGIFSTFFPWTWAYMNTIDDHATDPAEVLGWDNGRGTWWSIFMNPGLAMGLDFDIERTGTLEGNLLGRWSGEGSLSAALYLYDGDDNWDNNPVLAEAEPQTLTLDLRNPTPFKLTLTPTEESDYIPYDPDQTMYLQMSLERNAPPQFVPVARDQLTPALLTEGWKLNLPLNEYHDRLTGEVEAASTVRLLAEGAVEKAGLPGTTLTYVFRISAQTAGTYEVDLAGNDAGLGELVPGGALQLEAGESRSLTLAVRIPSEAKEGDQFEVLLFAHDREDPSRMAIARTKSVATRTGEAVPDEEAVFAAAKEAANETPGPGAALVLVGLGALALARRRNA